MDGTKLFIYLRREREREEFVCKVYLEFRLTWLEKQLSWEIHQQDKEDLRTPNTIMNENMKDLYNNFDLR